MKLSGPLLVVEDIKRSQRFYEDVLGMEVLMDLDGNLTFKAGYSLQDKKIWADFLGIGEEEIRRGGNNFELYFEEDDFDAFLTHFASITDIEMVNQLTEYPWGQRVVRFYDPDHHIVEVAQSMRSVVRGFLAAGMSPEDVSRRTQHPIEFIRHCMEE